MKKFKWARFKGEMQWIRCYAHILNLIAQSILQPFGTVKKRSAARESKGDVNSLDSSDESEGEDAEEQICRAYNSGDEKDPEDADEAVQREFLEPELTLEDIHDLCEEDEDEDLYTTAICKQTLAKFRAVARKLRKSPNSKSEFVELCKEMRCEKPHSIVQDVRTRWNSTLDQLVSIIRCEKAIMAWQKDKKYGLDRKFHINGVDIQLANDLVSILQVFYEQTLQVSIPGSARLTHIIVFIDEITDLLSNAIKGEDNKYPPALRNACRVGLQLTNKYYTLTDCLPLFRIAMDEYFKIAGWESEWITEALRLTREMFDTYYKPVTNGPPPTDPRKVTKVRYKAF
ncbi:hypothetical protein PGT21_003462 [Puccinia graminis f. sp. tritici]|uniref:hAT-like transposase RNase-H fold domain-containing protein n=1 Tax=Puccinia graminis f. sp. tritici TaxID=56615 RepID=A0A5B0P7D7_PUCGR|nr:hypothetical protein PGT21_003462 [Puccinia graminis f. sp. tritici]